jgi:hypothetical protein
MTRVLLVLLGAGLLAVASSACSDTTVGRRCYIESSYIDGGVGLEDQTVISSPALECPARTCLHLPKKANTTATERPLDLCTDECSADSDCEKDPKSPCKGGFECKFAVVTGPFQCTKFCICQDEQYKQPVVTECGP